MIGGAWGVVMTTQGLCLPRGGLEPDCQPHPMGMGLGGDPIPPSISADARLLGSGQWGWAWAWRELASWPMLALTE